MTRDRDIERVLEQWFTEGPAHMPDHLFDVVVDRIDRVPQRRLARLQTRLLAMNFNIRLAAAAALFVVVAGAGAFMLTRPSGAGVAPSPRPSLSSSPNASLSPLPAALSYKWVGSPRTVPEISPAITESRLLLDTGTSLLYGAGGPDPILFSGVGLSSPDTIQFKMINAESGCRNGDVGSYAFTLSPSGRALSLHEVADACRARAGAISGDWNRADCPNKNSACLGDLDAGPHVSAGFNPFVPRTAWVANYGALSYTVPEGWTNNEDCDGCYFLSKQGAPENDPTMFLFDDVVAHSQAQSCSTAAEPGVGHSAAAIGAWLTTLPGLVATAPSPVTIGGLSGVTVDLSVSPGWTGTCPYAYSQGLPLVSTFVDAEPSGGGGFDWNVQGDGRTRAILLDIGDGRVLLLDIEAQSKATYDAFLPGAMQVVNTFQFNR
jgi:hypothetical protein